ncbi:hypothetical protein [Achromobacter sp. DH1f]|uniref:hypothetical protein n=1 Tax=Achromobacter sp. DH1f TaxID=1397275 RepID=UPI0004688143|nr:hypothetical protein [Achromobacter sp. DH1f]
MNQVATPTVGHEAETTPAKLSSVTLGILIELANGCAKDHANWGTPGSNDRHSTHYYLELIRRRISNLNGGETDKALQRATLLHIARHALAGIEALDTETPDHRAQGRQPRDE